MNSSSAKRATHVHDSPHRPSPSTFDRLTAISLSQALHTKDLRITTGVDVIDEALNGGLFTGQVTEIYGPPGSGKTFFGIHLVAQLLRQGHRTTWFECSQPFPATRLRDCIVDEETSLEKEEEDLSKVICCRAPTLAALVSLVKADLFESGIIHDQTRLIVIDDLTTLINASFPPEQRTQQSREVEGSAIKKARIIALLGSNFSRLAARHQCAVIVLNKLSTKISHSGANLESALGDSWASGCATRVVLYRDHSTDPQNRYMAIQKIVGRNLEVARRIPYRIISTGLEDVKEASQRASQFKRARLG